MIMMHESIFEIKLAPNKETKLELLKKLSDEEFKIVEHMHFNKQLMPLKEDMKSYITNGMELGEPELKTLIEIISYAEQEDYDEAVLVDSIFKYLFMIDAYDGAKQARRVAKIIFCEERLDISTKDVKEERERRKKNG